MITMLNKVIDELLEKACPAIRYRVRREILHQPPEMPQLQALQDLILADPAVRQTLAAQGPDGWIARDFHGADSMEGGIRLLCEKGMEPSQPPLARALQALTHPGERLGKGLAKAGPSLDAQGLDGPELIRAVVFAYAGIEDRPDLQAKIRHALQAFQTVRDMGSPDEPFEPYRGKRVLRQGFIWPGVYHLRLLAFTQGWRSAANMKMAAEAVQRLVDYSPLPVYYLRWGSQLIAPGLFCMDDFNPSLLELDDNGWMFWFHRAELLARLGVVPAVPALQRQVHKLAEMMNDNDGWFTLRLESPYFRKIGPYAGLMLEQDWRVPRRRIYDLTFRSLLILHYSGYLDLQCGA